MSNPGGPASPVFVTNVRPTGLTAIGVKAMNQSTADRSVEGGPAHPVYIVSQAEINAGTFVVDGDPSDFPMCSVQDGRAVEGGPATPVFIASGAF